MRILCWVEGQTPADWCWREGPSHTTASSKDRPVGVVAIAPFRHAKMLGVAP
jgi:hypothetical protein